jgi:hypothetical protein
MEEENGQWDAVCGKRWESHGDQPVQVLHWVTWLPKVGHLVGGVTIINDSCGTQVLHLGTGSGHLGGPFGGVTNKNDTRGTQVPPRGLGAGVMENNLSAPCWG